MYRKNAWENLAEDEKEQLSAFAKDYMAFLNNGKTERECVAEACVRRKQRASRT